MSTCKQCGRFEYCNFPSKGVCSPAEDCRLFYKRRTGVYRELIDWCRAKIKSHNSMSDKYKRGYEDAMRAVMSKLSDMEKQEK